MAQPRATRSRWAVCPRCWARSTIPAWRSRSREVRCAGGILRSRPQAGRAPARRGPQGRPEAASTCATPLITIDGEDARDFDAVYCEPVELGTGQRSVGLAPAGGAIADVALDPATRWTSSAKRLFPAPGPGCCRSNGLLCSLNPEVDRLVLVCDMVIPASGARLARSRPTSSTTRSCTRMPAPPPTSGARYSSPADRPRACARSCPQVQHLYESCTSCWRRAASCGAIDFDTVETKIVCNELGRIEQIAPSVRNDAQS